MNPQSGEILKVVESDDPLLTNTYWRVMGSEVRRTGLYLHLDEVSEAQQSLRKNHLIIRWGAVAERSA